MIFYFSATGNTLHVARNIAQENEEMVDIEIARKEGKRDFFVREGRVIILSPTYDWALPLITEEFLEEVNFSYEELPSFFFIATYGTTAGSSFAFAKKIMRKKGIHFLAAYGVKMPDTWTPMFDLSNQEKVAAINHKADIRIAFLKQRLQEFKKEKRMGIITPYFCGAIGRQIYKSKVIKTKNFSVDPSRCISCGLCAKRCPEEAIEIKNGFPTWQKETCLMCLRCLHNCPKEAISRGKATLRHGQYRHP